MVATGVTVVDETVSSAAAIGIAGTEVVDVVAGTEVNGVVSAITTVVPRTSEVPGSAEDELSPQPAATITASRRVATRRFTV